MKQKIIELLKKKAQSSMAGKEDLCEVIDEFQFESLAEEIDELYRVKESGKVLPYLDDTKDENGKIWREVHEKTAKLRILAEEDCIKMILRDHLQREPNIDDFTDECMASAYTEFN